MNPSALGGLTVLDLTRLLPGAFCTLLLADLGADVVKVEHPDGGDPTRALGAPFAALNRNKRSVALDLKDPADHDAFLGLAARADVVVESFRPGVADRLGVGYERLRETNPQLVHCALTGYGPDGPLADRAGHDLNYLALTGVLALNGGEPGVQIADLTGGLLGAFGILAALRERDRSGEGQSVDVSLAHGALALLGHTLAASARPRRRELPLHGGAACYGVYDCADGRVSLAALEPKFWSAWCAGVGRPDLEPHAFARPGSEPYAAVAAILAARSREEWSEFAAEHDCCLEPVLEPEEALASELVAARGMLLDADARLLGSPLRLSRTPPDERRLPAPELDEHRAQVLGNT